MSAQKTSVKEPSLLSQICGELYRLLHGSAPDYARIALYARVMRMGIETSKEQKGAFAETFLVLSCMLLPAESLIDEVQECVRFITAHPRDERFLEFAQLHQANIAALPCAQKHKGTFNRFFSIFSKSAGYGMMRAGGLPSEEEANEFCNMFRRFAEKSLRCYTQQAHRPKAARAHIPFEEPSA